MARILLVEDEPLLRELAFEDLSDAGFDVTCAKDGDQALAVLQDDRSFDLLFTDIRMPSDVDGWGLAAEAKRLIPGLRVIYASGLSDQDNELGPKDRYLPKPYRPAALFGLLAELGLEA